MHAEAAGRDAETIGERLIVDTTTGKPAADVRWMGYNRNLNPGL